MVKIKTVVIIIKILKNGKVITKCDIITNSDSTEIKKANFRNDILYLLSNNKSPVIKPCIIDALLLMFFLDYNISKIFFFKIFYILQYSFCYFHYIILKNACVPY